MLMINLDRARKVMGSNESEGQDRDQRRDQAAGTQKIAVLHCESRARALDDDRPLGTLLHLACHPEVMPRRNRLLSADFVGDLCDAWRAAREAIEHVRATRRPAFLHLRTVRLLGHALAATRLHTTAKTIAAPPEMFAEHRAIRDRYWSKYKFQLPYMQQMYAAWLNKVYRLKRQIAKIILRQTFDWLPANRLMK